MPRTLKTLKSIFWTVVASATFAVYGFVLYFSGRINGPQTVATTLAPPCEPKRPCTYGDKVDLRIIVITYNRPTSLLKLLRTLDELELDNDRSAMEIWIDRNRATGAVDDGTTTVASEFRWSRGPSRVRVHAAHVGIYGQWIDTWRPGDDSDDELALILEDDLSVSKFAYRWLRAVFRAYGNRTDFAGASIQSDGLQLLSTRRTGPLAGPKNDTVVMYECFGSWGFAPKPLHWRRFQVRSGADRIMHIAATPVPAVYWSSDIITLINKLFEVELLSVEMANDKRHLQSSDFCNVLSHSTHVGGFRVLRQGRLTRSPPLALTTPHFHSISPPQLPLSPSFPFPFLPILIPSYSFPPLLAKLLEPLASIPDC